MGLFPGATKSFKREASMEVKLILDFLVICFFGFMVDAIIQPAANRLSVKFWSGSWLDCQTRVVLAI